MRATRQGSPTAVDTTLVRVAPRRSLLLSALVSGLLVLIPVSALLYWYAIPRGQGGYVALAQGIVVLLAAAVLGRQLSVDARVSATELSGRGIFSPMVGVPLARIAQVDLVPTFVGQYPEPVTQLLVRDAEGRRLFRMRGNFWRDGDLERIAAALPVAPRVATEPITIAEFFAAYPGSAYWFEGRPWVVALLLAAVAALGAAVAVGVTQLLGMPILG